MRYSQKPWAQKALPTLRKTQTKKAFLCALCVLRGKNIFLSVRALLAGSTLSDHIQAYTLSLYSMSNVPALSGMRVPVQFLLQSTAALLPAQPSIEY